MYRLRILAVAMMFLLPAAFAWSQDTRDDAKRQQEEAKPHDEKPQDQVKPPKDEKQRPPDAKPEDAKPARDEHEKVQSKETTHNEKSARIPDEKFRANFGREHTFTATTVIQTRTVVVGQTRFVYGGYNFVILQPWPTGWVMTDMCYIDFIDGEYFLVDVVHPEFRIGLSVVL